MPSSITGRPAAHRRYGEREAIGEVDALHHHRQLVEAVRTQAKHLEMQIPWLVATVIVLMPRR